MTNLGYQMLSVEGDTQAAHLDLAIQAAPHFDLSTDKASAIAKGMTETVHGGWRHHAEATGVPDSIRKRLDGCFMRQGKIIGAGKYHS